MSDKLKHRTFPEKLYNANAFPSGALVDIPPADLINAKVEYHSKKKKK